MPILTVLTGYRPRMRLACLNIYCKICINYFCKFKLKKVLQNSIITTATEDIGLKIEKVTGENYCNWKLQMKMYLISWDWWEIVTKADVWMRMHQQKITTNSASTKIRPWFVYVYLWLQTYKFMCDLLKMQRTHGAILQVIGTKSCFLWRYFIHENCIQHIWRGVRT